MFDCSRRSALAGALAALGLPAMVHASASASAPSVRAKRLLDHPIIEPGMDARMGANIEGPSLIRTPDWLPGRLGVYYLYFADHKGDYIRLAYADKLTGPWRIHTPGSLQLAQSGLLTTPPPAPPGVDVAKMAARNAGGAPPEAKGIPSELENANVPHVASPDVHVDEKNRRIVMYYHGLAGFEEQRTRVATSPNGLDFKNVGGDLGPSYMRTFPYGGYIYASTMPGQYSRSRDGFSAFERGPTLFGNTQRHVSLMLRGDTLNVFWTKVGDAPERIYLSTIDLRPDWSQWKASEPIEVMRPERPWEGADLPIAPSYRSAVNVPVNQFRDPCIYEEGGRTYMVYAVKGEHGLGLAELFL